MYWKKQALRQSIIQAHMTESLARTKRLPRLMELIKRMDSGARADKGDYILRKMAEEKGVKV